MKRVLLKPNNSMKVSTKIVLFINDDCEINEPCNTYKGCTKPQSEMYDTNYAMAGY